MALLLGSLVSALMINPKNYQKTAQKQVPLVEFQNYEVKKTGVDKVLVSFSGRHYKTHEELDLPQFISEQNGSISSVSSHTATLKGETITMNKDVVYSDSDGYLLLTQKAIYNRSSGDLMGSGNFVLTQEANKVLGSSFLVKTHTKSVEAKNTKAFYTIKE